jgi:uncharacterized Zn finger protein (UPF0148 family)
MYSMAIVAFRCPSCGVEHTPLRSDGRTFCLNCQLRRRRADAGVAVERSPGGIASGDRSEPSFDSAA